jgi:hypothetical protein
MDAQMNHDTTGSRMRRAGQRRSAIVAALVATTLLAAACSGGPGTTGSNNSAKPLAQVLDAYTQCLHKNGELWAYFVRAPSSATPSIMVWHGYEIEGADVTSPQFQSAAQTCQHILTQTGTPPSAALLHQQFENSVKSANCMHTHGYPDWPEPKVVNGRVANGIPSGIDLNSTQFQATAKICHP